MSINIDHWGVEMPDQHTGRLIHMFRFPYYRKCWMSCLVMQIFVASYNVDQDNAPLLK